MAWLLAGMLVGQCAQMCHIARKIPGPSQKLSKVKMLSRLLDNRHIRVRAWYEPVARELLTAAVNHGQTLRLIVDGTKVGSRLVDRSDRRDPSIFRIGLDILERCLANHESYSIRSSPYQRKVYGSYRQSDKDPWFYSGELLVQASRIII